MSASSVEETFSQNSLVHFKCMNTGKEMPPNQDLSLIPVC